ncbi:hypothetical protein BIW11_04409 [Tropilaelaps mercedesae]|uniref:Uncharacterized protein n=1 Tax=Tropilaelaps mercedesae TaxID=418985 RepID=A0A1V9X6V0_9ACAR|nr:hypothetical protein BIW11_04409 [Tropilaelaps mercedesae]
MAILLQPVPVLWQYCGSPVPALPVLVLCQSCASPV